MITLQPEGALQRRQYLARQTVDVAQEHLYDALLHDVARIVRDALPTATYLVLEVNDQHHYDQPPYRVGLRRITSRDNPALWARDQQPSAAPAQHCQPPCRVTLAAGPDSPDPQAPEQQPGAALAEYRTGDDAPWPKVVEHIEQLLTMAIGTERAGMWWEPWTEDGNTVFWCKLPTAADVAAIQARKPRHLDAYLTEDDPRPWAPMWFASQTTHPMLAVAGVAITASVADDDVLTVEIDPTKTDPRMMRPAGPGTVIRVRLADTAVPAPAAATVGPDAEDGDEGEDEVCATEGCDGRLDDGEGWDGRCGNCADRIYAAEQGERDGDTGPGTELVLASSADPAAPAPQRIARPAPTPDVPVTLTSQLKNLLPWYEGDGEMRYGDIVEDGRHDNGRRAGFAALAVLAFAYRVGAINDRNDEDPATVIGDLLADLRHLADSLELDFDELDRRGLGHYVPELYGEF
ncbi:hypothetical protein GCM10027258_80620 [Amycolatopsis stemonae]